MMPCRRSRILFFRLKRPLGDGLVFRVYGIRYGEVYDVGCMERKRGRLRKWDRGEEVRREERWRVRVFRSL